MVEVYAPLIPLLFFFIRKPKRSVWINFLISYLTVYILLVYSANHFILFITNNHIVYTVLFGVTFCFFALILEQFLLLQKFKFFNRAVIIIIVLFFVVDAVWGEGISVFNSYSSAITNLVLVG